MTRKDTGSANFERENAGSESQAVCDDSDHECCPDSPILKSKSLTEITDKLRKLQNLNYGIMLRGKTGYD